MNILLDLTLVLVFSLGVTGVALATVFAQGCSWLFSLFYVNYRYPELRIRPFCFRFDRELFRQIIGIGVPAGIQTAMQAVGVMAVMSKANSYGEAFMGGYNVGSKIDSVTFLFIQCVSSAVTAFVGQNVGARKLDRVQKGIGIAVGMTVAWCFFTMALVVPFRSQLVSVFSPDPEVIYAGSCYLRAVMLAYPLFAVMFTMNAALRGTGDSLFPMVTVVISMIVLRVPCVYWFADTYGAGAMFWGFVPGWAVGAAMSLFDYFSGRWKRFLPRTEEADRGQ